MLVRFGAWEEDEAGKKRRLSGEQVEYLEKSFEAENKLDHDRKRQLAKDLGLEPRQVAIWFQNRRARWKTKQMEKDYDLLRSSFDSLNADYQALLVHTDLLKAQLLELSDKKSQDPPPENPGEEFSKVEDEGVFAGVGDSEEDSICPKAESSCSFGFAVEDHHAFWSSWSY